LTKKNKSDIIKKINKIKEIKKMQKEKNIYLITISNEKGKFKRIIKETTKDEYDTRDIIERNGDLYVEDIEKITKEEAEILKEKIKKEK
jgi:hypothetical protein